MKKGVKLSKELEEAKNQALKISIKEGSAASVSSSLGDSFITPLALHITPPTIQNIVIGILSSFSLLSAQLSQFLGARLMEKHTRKNIVVFFVLLQSLMWIPIAGLSILYWKGILTGSLPFILIILYTVLAITGGIAYPSWFSWMGDLIPEESRGKYFSKRNLVVGIIGLAVAILAAILLEEFKKQNILVFGFSAIFFLAFVFRFVSHIYFKKQFEPEYISSKEDYFSFLDFVKRKDNYRKFAIYQAMFNFALMFASPFFAVYMLQELKFNYVIFIIVQMSSTVFYLLFLPLIGKISDKSGNLKLLYISNTCFILSPLLWSLFTNPLAIILIPQIIVGLGNAAYAISLMNFTYSSVQPSKRGTSIAYTNILIGIGTFIGALSGGIMLNYIPINFTNKFILLFIIAGILRFLVMIIFLPRVEEVKITERTHPLHHKVLHPFKFVNTELHHLEKFSHARYTEGLKVWATPKKDAIRKKL